MIRIALPVLLVCLAVPANGTAATCPDNASSIAQARIAIQSDDISRQREVLACLIEAVAALDAKLTAITTGKATFDGPIYAPRGIIYEHHTSANLNHVDARQHRATEEAR